TAPRKPGAAPRAGRGSKRSRRSEAVMARASPLAQGRGSKPVRVDAAADGRESPLAQGRGSKLRRPRQRGGGNASPPRRGVDRNWEDYQEGPAAMDVAPRAGAWIETSWAPAVTRSKRSPLAQGRGSKRDRPVRHHEGERVAPVRGRGSK